METVRFESERLEDGSVKLTRHYTEEVVVRLKPVGETGWDWLEPEGYTHVFNVWSGYGHALHSSGRWDHIDFQEKEVITKGTKDPRDDKYAVLGNIVSESEWGTWVEEIEYQMKKEVKPK